ncbi:TRAP transporter small permease [Roseovarius aestuarii]|nr:TRAP transporter small permease [Roseovarius aestuarii]
MSNDHSSSALHRPTWLRKLATALDKASSLMLSLAMICISAIWLLMISEVAIRTFVGVSLLVTWEFSSYLLGWSTFLAAPAAARNMVHVRVSAVTDALPSTFRQLVVAIAYLIAFVAGVFCSWAISKQALEALERGVVTQTIAQLPHWILFSVPALGMTIFAAVSLLSALETLADGWSGSAGAKV